MRKKLALLLLAAGMFLALPSQAKAAEQSGTKDVTYVETTAQQLNDEEWERENDPLYAKYNSKASRATSLTTATTFTTANWGEGLKHDPKFDNCKRVYGIDVSKWQKTIDWNKVKEDGVEFVIIRLGYRAQATGTLTLDERFDENIQGAHDAGLKIGVYFYTQAITTAEAKAEAQFCVQKLQNYAGYLSFPVMYDIENTSTDRMGKAKVTTAQRTAFCKAFCDEAIANGYKSGVYASLSYFQDNLKPETFSSEYHNWLARYATAYNYNGKQYNGSYEMWQYTSTGKVNGISGNVDLDVYYAQTPDKVTEVKQTANTTNSITLSWKKQNAVNGYEVQVCNENEEVLATLYTGTESIYVNGLADGTTYKFKIRAYFAGDETICGTYSDVAAFTTKPAKVAGIVMSAYGYDSITLSWPAVNGATGYKIYSYNSSTKKNTLISSTKSTSYKVTKLEKKKRYYYKVVAYRTLSGSTYTGAYSDVFQAATRPDKVTGLKKKSNTATSVTVTWTKQSGVSGYEVACYDSKNNLVSKTCTTGNKNSLVIRELASGVTYKFKVRSYLTSKAGNSYGAYSASISMTTKPAKISRVRVSTTTKSSVTLAWDKVTGATGYKVYTYNTSTKKSTLIATTRNTSYKVTKLKTAKKYSYVVKAYKVYAKTTYLGAASDYISVSTAPGLVTDVKQTKRSAKTITLTWKKVSGASGYRVYRYDADGKLVGKFDTKATTFTDTDLQAGKYTYKVRAFVRTKDHDSFGSYSKACAACTTAWKVSGLEMRNATADSAELWWKKQPGVSGYEVYLYDDETDSYKKIATTKAYRYIMRKLEAGVTYQVKVRGFITLNNKKYYGGMSNEFELCIPN